MSSSVQLFLMHKLIEQADALAQQQVHILQRASALYKIRPIVRGAIFLFVVGVVVSALVYPYSVGLLLFFMGFVNYMLLIAFRMGNNLGHLKNNPGNPIQTDPVVWPSMSIIVPLKREGDVVYGTLQAIADLDYPTNLKQVIIVVEETDQMTLEVLSNSTLPDGFELLQIPEQPPFTKGRALLHALRRASGAFVTVYDAESRPEPQQLRKAARILKQSNDALLCLGTRKK